ncbi:MAG: hypothetical protein J07HQW2_03333 [Haloquadratum walsbyi J07HQW2]|jgi:hypothetical protein|uniref:Uncharacterized protein n=1 Tax=Haloquadratum walsbyi J07HQW2 TaxID=1238425 RepID=U1N1X2_9EURY|nr:MAG: hypothetical protein J07HQW2_03333 [Haloquadratum walsbyi J07HQW2]
MKIGCGCYPNQDTLYRNTAIVIIDAENVSQEHRSRSIKKYYVYVKYVADSLLVYDGSNPAFRAAATTVTCRLSNIRPVRWESESVQRILEAQFDACPFIFALIEDETIYVGAATIRRVLEEYDVSTPLIETLEGIYPVAAGPFGRLVHGREPANINGCFPLKSEAKNHLTSLQQRQKIPVREVDAESGDIGDDNSN